MRCGMGGAIRASHDSAASEARLDDVGRKCPACGIPARKSGEQVLCGAASLGGPSGTRWQLHQGGVDSPATPSCLLLILPLARGLGAQHAPCGAACWGREQSPLTLQHELQSLEIGSSMATAAENAVTGWSEAVEKARMLAMMQFLRSGRPRSRKRFLTPRIQYAGRRGGVHARNGSIAGGKVMRAPLRVAAKRGRVAAKR
jgi:hypothetical protein